VQIIINGFDRATQETRIYIKSRLRQLDPEHIRLLILARRDVESTDKQIICDVEICDNEGLEVYYRCKNCPKTNRIDICEDCHNKGEACPMDNKHKLELPSKLEVFIVTPDVDLARYIRTKIEEKMPLNNEDIDSDLESDVAEAELLGLLCAEDSSFMENTIQSIVENSRGRFLLAKLYTKSLMNKFTASQIKEAIDEMNDSKYEIAELIDHLLEKDLKRRLATLPDEQQKFAKKIFSIIYYAKRDLSFRELQHALAVSPGMRVYSEYGEAAKNQILRMTKGFVTIRQDTTQIVRFDDGVLNNYFDKTRNEWFPTGEVEMAKICLDYLSLDAFSKPCEIGEFVEKEKSHSFLAYAVENWGHHARLAGNEEVGIATARFLHDHERIQAYIQAAWETNVHKGQKWDVRKRIHALHIFAWFDLWKFISLLDVPLDLNATEGTYGQTPLIYACKRGNIETARHLLLLGASVNMTSTKGRTALHEAIYRKDIAIVELLLSSWHSQDLDVNTRNAKHANRTPLMIAILEGCDKIALSLISHPDIIVTIRDKYGFTALSLASWENRQCIVDALLVSRFSRQIEVDAREIEGGRSALILAAERNHDEIMRALLNAGADPNLRDLRNGTAIFRAVEGRAIEAFKLLVEYKADLQLKDERSRSLMHCAAEQTNQTEIICRQTRNNFFPEC
jgi:ankyrin repeat protein/Holliday junction resolvasome RuvABC endonuclease subunit